MLNGKQKRYLRALANGLKPITQVGKDGINDGLFNSIDDAFNTHELIKINMLKTCEEDLNEIAIEVCANCSCELVQKIGKTLVLYKRAKEPKILLP
ncbi:MAG: ribosome assembly RNA-binding protein YhbY [Erysipelotrichaceae bacterium]|nr:ribosome assembly RNA-binding protein YhbY [Erysipelotrichaceae bacterium]